MKEILDKLYSLRQDYRTKDLEKITILADFLGNPHLDYPVVHIAGTNGKGSVCCLLASILQENGYKVGLYTSPHIIKFNERIKINGKHISDEDVKKNYDKICKISAEVEASFFDITTAIAFKYFSDNKVDIAVIETGLGGRFDSTNIVNPILSIITNIDKDHTDILGETLEKIAIEKAGIIKRSVPVIVQDNNPKIIEVLLQEAQKRAAHFYVNYFIPHIEFGGYDNNEIMICDAFNRRSIVDFLTDENYFFTADDLMNKLSRTDIFSPLLGKHQLDNIRLVVFATILLCCHNFSIKKYSIGNGVKKVIDNTGLHFRIENVSQNKNPIILDVAHNPKSISLLVNTLKDMYPENNWNFIFAAMKDKNIKQMLQPILPVCEKLIVVQPNIERAAEPINIQKTALELGFKNIELSDIRTACEAAKTSNKPYVICGSFFIMKEVAEALKIKSS